MTDAPIKRCSPGPWAEAVYNCISALESGTGNIVCEAPDERNYPDSYKYWKANKAIILQAKPMLEALQGLLAYCRDLAKLQDEYPECVSKAEAIVLELTGELPEPSPWIEWHDGKCPVPEGVEIEVELRNGKKNQYPAGYYTWERDAVPHKFQIVRYRVVK